MKIVFLMAGEGRRFMGYQNIPKPLVKLVDTELIKWAVCSYNFIGCCLRWSDIYFITRRDHIEEFKIDKLLKVLFSPEINIRYVEHTTRGPAETALFLEKDISPNEQVVVSDCDMFFNSLPLLREIIRIKDDEEIYGILPYVKREDNQNSWSYVKLEKNDSVVKVNEKDQAMFEEGCPGIVGAYTFNRWKYFVEETKRMIKEDDLAGEEGNREFFMSQVFKRMISNGKTVKGVDVYPSWILGTPKQFLAFENLIKNI